MNNLIEKIVERLKGLTHNNPMVTDNYILRKDVLDIINEEAKAYNNGWIPISSGELSKPNVAVLVSTSTGQVDVDYYGEYCKDFIGLKGIGQQAIAWQPLPQPYKASENESGM